jgi:deoxyribonuclease V
MSATESSAPLCAIDVYYWGTSALAAAVTFNEWTDARPAQEITIEINDVADYEPGRFYLRELPCILAVLGKLPRPPRVVVVDGYVWLREREPGLGFHVYEALKCAVPVIGVAKTAFDGSPHAVPVIRGHSTRPLYITAAGIDPATAAVHVASMHGEHRLPALLKAVDLLCRS